MKVHFKSSDTPLKEGSDILAPCGEPVPNAGFVMMQDTKAVNQIMDWGTFRNSCRACLRIPMDGRFVYALVNGELTRHPEDL